MKTHLKNLGITISVLLIAFFISEVFQNIFNTNEYIVALFIFSVFIISLSTDGYMYGVVSAITVVFIMNYVFTPPFFYFDFKEMSHLLSSIIMVTIAVLTCTLTTKIKKQEAEKAEHETEKMRGNLLRAISHDLRTPLTNISGSATILLENEQDLSLQQKRKLIQGMQEDSNWLIRMVENLLSVTKLDDGKLAISKQSIVLDELMDHVLKKFRKQYPNQKIELKIPDEWIVIQMDPLLIEQVLLNLLQNSVEHAKNMTELKVCVRKEGKRACFEIKDNGCGIQEGHKTYDNKKKNMGIGLVVCSTIIKAHGGKLVIENRKTGGVCAHFALEIEDEENE